MKHFQCGQIKSNSTGQSSLHEEPEIARDSLVAANSTIVESASEKTMIFFLSRNGNKHLLKDGLWGFQNLIQKSKLAKLSKIH